MWRAGTQDYPSRNEAEQDWQQSRWDNQTRQARTAMSQSTKNESVQTKALTSKTERIASANCQSKHHKDPDQTNLTTAEANVTEQQHNEEPENNQTGGIKRLASKISNYESTGAIYFRQAKTIPTALWDAIDELSSVARGS